MTNKPLMTESNPEVSPAALLRFFLTLGNLKTTKRTGWIENEIAMPESISDHMHRMSMMALMVSDSTIDIARCVLICLVHDVAEAIVGDIAPSARMAKADKQRQEEAAMQGFVNQLGDSKQSKFMYDLWLEYESAESKEALLAKDLDKYEMIVQAFEYEKSDNKVLDPFFESTKGKFTHPQVISWVNELYQQRASYFESRKATLSSQ
ncbi:hypothetical protein DSO57_1014918 [Entomophthora muscae]|uniref:Uncharacterized protein n=1 Tax=Entomophthora muscae TaxID=34485 RepID=A0ACC2T5B4_9FUNG|nr:hypothetical protein DSO57_1014918 [Entomophthora muscae]